jgi:hypothetical protein
LEFPQGISESHPPNDKPGKTIIIEGSKYPTKNANTAQIQTKCKNITTNKLRSDKGRHLMLFGSGNAFCEEHN